MIRAGGRGRKRRKGGGRGSGLVGLLKGPVGLVLLGLLVVLGVGYAVKFYQVDVLASLPKLGGSGTDTAKTNTGGVPAGGGSGNAAPPPAVTPAPANGQPAGGTGTTPSGPAPGQGGSGTTTADPNAAIYTARTHVDRSAGAADTMLMTVYYADGLKNGDALLPVQIRMTRTVSTIQVAAEQVVRAPEDLKLYSSVPAGTKVKGADIKPGGVAVVDLSPEAANVQSTAAAQNIMASFVYTLTEFPNVKAVQVWINGKPAVLHGIEWSKPLTRADLQAQHAIKIEPIVKFTPSKQ